MDLNSEQQGFEESRLPTFTAEESAEVAGAFDFLGMNVYSTDLTYPGPGYTGVSWYDDKDTSVTDDPKGSIRPLMMSATFMGILDLPLCPNFT